jgi:type VI secretion system secreted protein Hcp
MPVDVFLKVDGINGESTDSRHRGEIDVLSWSWRMTSSLLTLMSWP